jgi:hypothetical protein
MEQRTENQTQGVTHKRTYTKMMTKNIQVVFLVLAVMTQSVDGFSTHLPLVGLKSKTTALPAWSMPLPSFSSQSFASLSTPYWYIDIANPTARRPVYNE